ncbi:MAG: DUF4416 family protein [Deltaproteobacteria bacterium]|nr:DUF4416 family protein [Deltaproteobacteria bacterium]
MSKPQKPRRVKLVVSLITGEKELIKPILTELENRFGAIDLLSERLEFNHTEYYNKEMGERLFRKLASFEPLIDAGELPSIKLFTNTVEDRFLTFGGRRRINIDPGYIAMEKMVLASCKNFGHRIYLRDGVYGDLTLMYRGKDFQPLAWTFPDYAEEGMRRFLRGMRDRYVMQLKTKGSRVPGV